MLVIAFGSVVNFTIHHPVIIPDGPPQLVNPKDIDRRSIQAMMLYYDQKEPLEKVADCFWFSDELYNPLSSQYSIWAAPTCEPKGH